MSRLRFVCIAPVAALFMQAAMAQSVGLLETERPKFSSTPFTLAPGVWQLEGGYQYTHDNDGPGLRLHTLPQALLRYGLAEDMELQFGWPGISWRKSGGQTDSGMNDASIAVKVQLADRTASTPVAFLVGMSLPVGDNEFSSDHFDPYIGAAWAHSQFFGTATITRSNGDYSFDNGVGLDFALRDDLRAFGEWHATIPEGGGSLHSLNGGIQLLRAANMQLDLHASLGLNDRAADYSLGAGLSYRF